MVVGVFDSFGSGGLAWVVVPHDERGETATGDIPPHAVGALPQ
jgi:hypothetical protein